MINLKIFGFTLSDIGEIFVIIGAIFTALKWCKDKLNDRMNANLKKFEKRDKELEDRNLAETRENRKTSKLLRNSIDKLNQSLDQQRETQLQKFGESNVKLENHEQRIKNLEHERGSKNA